MSTKRYLHSRWGLVVPAILLVFGFTSPAHAQLGLGLVPMRAELTAKPGQQLSGALKLSSESGTKTRIRAEIDDFSIDNTSTPQFERDLPQESAFSCKKWLSLNPMEIELDKGGSLLARYTFRVPSDVAEGSYNCAVGFTTLPSADEPAAQGMGMHMAVRIVTVFYIQIGNPPIVGGLKQINLEALPPAAPASSDDAQAPAEPKSGGWQAVVVLENQGLVYFRPTGKLDVLDAQGKQVETLDFPSVPILRARSQRVILPLKTHLEPGNYKLRVNVDIGTGEIQQGTADVVVEAL